MKKKLFALLLALVLAISLVPSAFAAPADTLGAWDGKTIDVSWYNKTDKTFYVATPAQFAGLAAIVNGIYNDEITNIIGDKNFIVDNFVNNTEYDSGGNNKSTDVYHYGADDFNGKTIYLAADLDMGGVYDSASSTWSGARYMPIGGQYLMAKNDAMTKLGSSFSGTLDGQGHTVYNIFCNRRCTTGNFGDGQSVGLIGRLGVHDNDPENIRPATPTVRNLAVTGYIYSNRSVGGIVGKIGKTVNGAIIENCANFATVSNTDSKGCGGIVGAGWNGGIVRNCYNAGDISSTYTCPTGGISGSNEIILENCYNIGKITAAKDSFAMAIGTNNGGAAYDVAIKNCWYLDGSAAGGGYYSGTPNNGNALTASFMKSADFIKTLGGAFIADANNINNGFPILAWQKNAVTHTPPAPPTYSDVAENAWYAAAAKYAVNAGLFDLTDGKFNPEAPMTRGDFATALVRLGGVRSEITDGTNPQGTITREQIITMLHRFAGKPTAAGDLSKFPDASKISDYARDAAAWAVANKIINGMGDGTFAPQGTTTRAQGAQMLLNYGK
ncbi:MAG: S-layer homology domain-containing protein [Oscillospiraceae bacterium]|nr:S-layer homology domain-containing protein [Oscillospiraceae bacterium]